MDAELHGRLAFEFKAPHKGFDVKKVKGIVARLIKVTEPAAATALEVIAGGKLYQVKDSFELYTERECVVMVTISLL